MLSKVVGWSSVENVVFVNVALLLSLNIAGVSNDESFELLLGSPQGGANPLEFASAIRDFTDDLTTNEFILLDSPQPAGYQAAPRSREITHSAVNALMQFCLLAEKKPKCKEQRNVCVYQYVFPFFRNIFSLSTHQVSVIPDAKFR